MSAPDEPTEISITTRMEKAAPGERRAALHACARDVGYLRRMNRLRPREVSRWASALQLWGERRAGLTWSQTSAEIIRGLREGEQ
jgi:hypothetical protein